MSFLVIQVEHPVHDSATNPFTKLSILSDIEGSEASAARQIFFVWLAVVRRLSVWEGVYVCPILHTTAIRQVV